MFLREEPADRLRHPRRVSMANPGTTGDTLTTGRAPTRARITTSPRERTGELPARAGRTRQLAPAPPSTVPHQTVASPARPLSVPCSVHGRRSRNVHAVSREAADHVHPTARISPTLRCTSQHVVTSALPLVRPGCCPKRVGRSTGTRRVVPRGCRGCARGTDRERRGPRCAMTRVVRVVYTHPSARAAPNARAGAATC